jgi:Na+/H+ antiporter NhaC
MAAILMTVSKRILSLNGVMEAWINGVRSMVMACVILVLAWTIGRICTDMKTAEFLVGISAEVLSPSLLPLITFLTAAAISFSTGSSWATMSILVPVVVPMAVQLMNIEANTVVHDPIFLSTFAAILSGSVFGDHCSPISDTTILSSTATCSDHIDHVRTQMPYAVSVAVIAMLVGYGGIGLNLSLPVILLVSILLLAVQFRFYAKPIDN